MSPELQVFLIIFGMVLALALGIWVGLGYPGLYDKYEATGSLNRRRRTPFEAITDWIVERIDRRGDEKRDGAG